MEVTDDNGNVRDISENEINRGILLDRLGAFADAETDADEKQLLNELANWLESVDIGSRQAPKQGPRLKIPAI